MTLNDYIDHVGDSAAAKRFGVEVRTIASWRRGERQPRPETAWLIEERTGGAVSFAECYPRLSVVENHA